MRDARKSRVYAAESVLPDVWTNVFGSNEDAQKWVDNLLATRWWRSRWRVSQITVGVGRNLNGKSYGWSAITLSPAARNPAVALHEIAHQVSPEGSDIASHGPEFCATFLFLVGHVMGADHSRALEQAFIEQGVRYRVAAGVVPRRPRYSVETETARRARQQRSAATPPSIAEVARAAATLRKLVAAGSFGTSGTKPRTRALEVARTLERTAVAKTPV